MPVGDDEARAAAYRASQVQRCSADAAREAALRGSEAAYQESLERTEALRRDDGWEGYTEEGCREHPEQLAN